MIRAYILPVKKIADCPYGSQFRVLPQWSNFPATPDLRRATIRAVASNQFPQEFYRLIPALYPHLAEILHLSGIAGREFLALSFVKNTGKESANGAVVLPISDLKALLIKIGEFKGDSGASTFIAELEERGLLAPGKISRKEKELLFPDSTGHRDVVSVSTDGHSKLEEINKRVEQLYLDATAGLAGATLRVGIKAFGQVAGRLITKLENRSMDRPDSSAEKAKPVSKQR
jgi:hypothetical protein